MERALKNRIAILTQNSPLNRAGKPVLAGSLNAQLLEILKTRICAGVLQPGAPLREMHLAREFSVSQATVREALLQLERIGLAVREANRGTTVIRLTPQDVRDRLEIRRELEPKACVKASDGMTEDDFTYLEILAKEISKDRKASEANYYETSQIDFQFHRYIWQKSGNALLCSTLEQVTLPLFAFVGLLRQVGRAEQRRGDPHKPIIEALRSRKARQIERIIHRHFEDSYNHFVVSHDNGAPAPIG